MELETKEIRLYLSEHDWIDIRMTKDIQENVIIKFSVNLSVRFSGKVYSAIRYDNTHGYTHIDRFWEEKKEIIEGMNNWEVLDLAQEDLSSNWGEYRNRVVKLVREGFDESKERY